MSDATINPPARSRQGLVSAITAGSALASFSGEQHAAGLAALGLLAGLFMVLAGLLKAGCLRRGVEAGFGGGKFLAGRGFVAPLSPIALPIEIFGLLSDKV